MPYEMPPPRVRQPGDDAPPPEPPDAPERPEWMDDDHHCRICDAKRDPQPVDLQRMTLWVVGIILLLIVMLFCEQSRDAWKVRRMAWITQHCVRTRTNLPGMCFACDDDALHCLEP